MRLGIVGSRNFTDEGLMRRALDIYEQVYGPLETLVSGGAAGADSMAVDIVRAQVNMLYPIDIIEHLPDTERYGWPAAAFERNTLIVNDSDVLFAFFGPGQPPSVNKSGTMDSVRKAIARRIPVHLYFQS